MLFRRWQEGIRANRPEARFQRLHPGLLAEFQATEKSLNGGGRPAGQTYVARRKLALALAPFGIATPGAARGDDGEWHGFLAALLPLAEQCCLDEAKLLSGARKKKQKNDRRALPCRRPTDALAYGCGFRLHVGLRLHHDGPDWRGFPAGGISFRSAYLGWRDAFGFARRPYLDPLDLHAAAVGHVAAAFKHNWIDGRDIIRRMTFEGNRVRGSGEDTLERTKYAPSSV